MRDQARGNIRGHSGHRKIALQDFIVLNRRKWFVVVVKKSFPLLICSGTTKSDSVVVQGLPLDQEYVAVFGLNTAS